MSIIKIRDVKVESYIPVCDICGSELRPQPSFMDAVSAKKDNGWHSRKIDGEWSDFCADCWEERKAG